MEIVSQQVELLSITPDPWLVVNRAARVSHSSALPEDLSKQLDFVKSLTRIGHHTPLEFVHLSFRLTTDRGVANELTRHRVGIAFVQRSTRYCDEASMRVLAPFAQGEAPYEAWLAAVQACEKAYSSMLALGAKKEMARSVLPLCLATELVMDVNLRELREVLKLRTAKGAHPQMRELMNLLLATLPEDVREIATMEDGR